MPVINPNAIRVREPKLLIPNHVPVGPVKVDWSLSISKGIICQIIPRGNRLVDITNGSGHGRWASGRLGVGGFSNYSGAHGRAADGVITNGDNECGLSYNIVKRPADFTIVLRWRKLSTPASFRYYLYNGNASQFALYSLPTGASFQFCGGTVLGNNTGLVDGKWHTIVARFDSATNNKYLDFSNGVSLSGSEAITAHVADFLAVGGRDDSTGRYSGGATKLCTIYDRVITDSEVESLLHNCTQTIVPR